MRNHHGEGVSGLNLGPTQSHQDWNQVDWYSIALSHLGSLGLQPGLTCPGDEAQGLVEDQSRAGGAGNWDPIKGTYLAQTPQQSTSRSLHRGTSKLR